MCYLATMCMGLLTMGLLTMGLLTMVAVLPSHQPKLIWVPVYMSFTLVCPATSTLCCALEATCCASGGVLGRQLLMRCDMSSEPDVRAEMACRCSRPSSEERIFTAPTSRPATPDACLMPAPSGRPQHRINRETPLEGRSGPGGSRLQS